MINLEIFKAYDIRGLYPQEINEEAARQIVWGFVDLFKPKTVVVGSDARKSSPDLKRAVVEAFLKAGIDVLDLGFCSTPVFYFSIINQKVDGGMMITASHNPGQYNGIKLCREGAVVIGGANGGYEIRDNIAGGMVRAIKSKREGQLKDIHLTEEYVQKTIAKFNLTEFKPLKIVADAGNGMAGLEIEKLFSEIPAELVKLYFKPDGFFPHHEANPLKEETLKDLKERTRKESADFGVAFDGDGDRIAFVDEKAKMIRSDFITALLAREILKDNPKEKICYEVKSSKIVKETILEAGGQPVITQTGHAIIKAQMKKENIYFGGELSGHYFFKEFGFIENPVYVLLKVMQIISSSGQKLSEIIQPFKEYFQSGELNFRVANVDEVLKGVENKYFNAEIKKIDGLTVEYPTWWFNLRKSNTEPLVRLNMEADSQQLLDEKLAEVKKLINF